MRRRAALRVCARFVRNVRRTGIERERFAGGARVSPARVRARRMLVCRDMPTTTVKELMSDVVETLTVGDTLATARQRIARGHIRHLPVVDGEERLVGLI